MNKCYICNNLSNILNDENSKFIIQISDCLAVFSRTNKTYYILPIQNHITSYFELTDKQKENIDKCLYQCKFDYELSIPDQKIQYNIIITNYPTSDHICYILTPKK